MSLFSSIRMAGNALLANEIALQVVGQNIANASTPGYIREEVILSPSFAQRQGGLILGTGVQIDAVVQKIDKFLDERLRASVSTRANTEALQQTFAQLEGILGELSDTDLSTAMDKFFNSIADILNQPEDASVRNLAVLQGQVLAQDIQQITQRVETLRSDLNDRVQGMAWDINRLIEEIRELNQQIAEAEGGGVSLSDAVGLRDQRSQALESLAELIGIRSVEQSDGTVSVFLGGEYLVTGVMSRSVDVVLNSNKGLAAAEIHLADTDNLLQCTSGELRGLLDSRDEVLGGFLDQFDDFARSLIFEFNKIYASGQGLKGYSELTSTYHVDDATAALNAAGLQFTPQNGSFQVLVRNMTTGLTKTTNITVDLNGLGRDTTLEDLRNQLSQIDGLTAEITLTGELKIRSLSQDMEISFAHDTSGVLAALGLNTFFTGTSSHDIGVNAAVAKNANLFAASAEGLGTDTLTAQALTQFLDLPLSTKNNQTLAVIYDHIVSDVSQGSAVAKATADGAYVFEETLRGQKMSISGVNLDEEAINMLAYQRAYQASAKYITALSELFNILVRI
ncbi:MAG: flagellar hook-associated protein FlgK [Pirellulales bacterium]|nr:flagellar hook-associated protein FlgK [Pirellulales bacterium]